MKKRKSSNSSAGFSMVELLVAAAIGAAVITAAAIGFAVVSGASTRGGRVDVVLPGATHANFYGSSASYVTMWPNPNYSEATKAQMLRDKLVEDVSAAAAVFCLGRSGSGGVRPASIAFDAETDLRAISTPEAFRQFLVDRGAADVSTFVAGQGGRLETENATIFVVGGLSSQTYEVGEPNSLAMIAIYEVDFVATSSPAGTYASVRRYDPDSAAVPTDYYHAFYPGEGNGDGGFRPLAVTFGRQGVGGAYDVAPNHPFVFLWWPDPLNSKLRGSAVPAAGGAPLRTSYANLAGRTSLFTVVPSFPGQ